MSALIKRIYENISERVTDSYYGKKITAAYLAYGGKYEFCRFYACDDGERSGTVHIYNSSMVIDGICSQEDISFLIEMTKPISIEMSSRSALHIPEYYFKKHRTFFQGVPSETHIDPSDIVLNGEFEKCFDILKESFDDLGSFDSWYVDISHRIRHGVSGIYLYGSSTVTKCFDIGGSVFVSGIATAVNERGKGAVGKLLGYLAGEFEKEGKKMCLFALDHRKTFYLSVGFVPADEDILYEWKGE